MRTTRGTLIKALGATLLLLVAAAILLGAAQSSLFFSGGGSCSSGMYCAYTGSNIAPWPTVVPSFGTQVNNGLIWSDPSLPSTIPSLVFRCTDQNTESNLNFTMSAGIGGSGDGKWEVNSNDTLVRLNNSGGSGRIMLLNNNPATLHCSPAINASQNLTNPGSSGSSYSFGAGTFDWSNPSIWYGISGPDVSHNGVVAKYNINTSTGNFTVVTPYLDLAIGMPTSTTSAPAWAPTTSYSKGAYVSVALSLANWVGTGAPTLGDLIKPTTNNPLNCAFKYSTSGTRGTQPTAWSKLTDVNCNTAQIQTEGGAVSAWRNIGNGGIFTLQALNSGTSGASINILNGAGHPDLLTLTTDNTITWQNSGVLILPNWNSFGGVSKSGNRFCAAFSMNSYGRGVGFYNSDNGDQGTGNFAACYDFATNTYTAVNTVTGIQSTVTCSIGVPGGPFCSGGTQSAITMVGTTPYNLVTGNCPFPIHNLKGGSTDYIVISAQGAFGTSSCPFSANGKNLLLDWQPWNMYDPAVTLQAYNNLANHWTIGSRYLYNYGANAGNFGFASGAYGIVSDSANPTAQAVTNWQVGAPFTNPCDISTVWTSFDVNPPCSFPNTYDSHMAIWNTPADDDTGVTCGTIFDISGHMNPVAPWHNEEICVSAAPTWAVGSTILKYTVWRFSHTFMTLTNPFFDTQFGISQISPSGHFIFFSTDWNCSFGDTNGNATNNCGQIWHPSTAYTSGQFVNPFASLGGAGTNFGVWKVTATGTSASSAPAWVKCTTLNVGTVITDGAGLPYQCVGPGTAKGEVMGIYLR